jgi:hypothetical protein
MDLHILFQKSGDHVKKGSLFSLFYELMIFRAGVLMTAGSMPATGVSVLDFFT